MNRDVSDSQPQAAGAANDLAGEEWARQGLVDQMRGALRVQIAAAFFSEMNAMEIEYVAISGYELSVEALSSDLDIVIRRTDRQRLLMAVRRAALRCGARIISRQRVHNGDGYLFVILRNGMIASLWCDAATKWYTAGRLWMKSEDLLRDRRMDPRGFYIAAPISRFLYQLIKRINKKTLSDRQGHELASAYRECSAMADTHMERMFPPRTVSLLKQALASEKWDEVQARLPAIRRQLHHHSAIDGIASRAYYFLNGVARKLFRIFTRTGLCVAILGPDGCGKSSVIQQYRDAFERPTTWTHLLPLLPIGSPAKPINGAVPRGQRSRGALASSAKLLFLWADYLLRYSIRVRPLLIRSTLVVFEPHYFDRYFYDLPLLAPHLRYGGPRWLGRFLAALTPMPDLVFFLDAPADVLQARTQAVCAEESARQAEAYRTVADCATLRGRAVRLDATLPLEQVVHQCVDQTFALLAMRVAKRLHLE